MTELFLEASVRTDHGKSPLRRLRRGGKVPGVVYGLHDPLSIQLDTIQASRLVQQLHGAERLVALRLADGKDGKSEERQVLIREVQTTPTGNKLLHIDFQEIDTAQKVHVNVEVRPVGTAEGVRLGGILQAVKHDVVVECLPTAIPEFIDTEVSHLQIGDSLHVSDIVFPAGVTPVTDPEETIIVISAPRVEVEEVEEEEVEAVEGVEEEGAAEEEAPAEGAETDQE
jgi:large subunit ribosomal protein L25